MVGFVESSFMDMRYTWTRTPCDPPPVRVLAIKELVEEVVMPEMKSCIRVHRLTKVAF